MHTIPESIFFIAWGILCASSGVYYARNAWTKTEDEYLVWLQKNKKSKWAHFWLSKIPKSFALWNDRILTIVVIVIGIIVVWVGSNSLWRNIHGG